MSMNVLHPSLSFSSKQQRRLRLAIRVLCFISFTNKQLHKKAKLIKKAVRRSLSHVSIDVHSNSTNQTSIHNDDIIDEKTLTSMTKEKNLEILSNLGGVDHLATRLKPNKNTISSCQKPLRKPFLGFIVESLTGLPTLLQVVFAVLSLGFDIKLYGRRQGWYDGGGILISVFLTVIFSSIIKFMHRKTLDQVLDKIGKTQVVRAFRDGHCQYISIFELVVGDIIFLNMGDYIPADGLLLNGFSLKVITKVDPLEEELISNENPFLLFGSKVFQGHGKMLVTCLFEKSLYKFDEVDKSSQSQPLQSHIKKLKFYILTAGVIVAIIHLLALELCYFTGVTKDQYGKRAFEGRNMKVSDVISSVFKHISSAITIAVASYPEGLPLAVTLTLYRSMKMMSSRHVLMKLSRWEDMGLISVICTDKTGILTLGVSEFWGGDVNVRTNFKNKKDIGVVNELIHEAIGFNTSGGSSIDKRILK